MKAVEGICVCCEFFEQDETAARYSWYGQCPESPEPLSKHGADVGCEKFKDKGWRQVSGGLDDFPSGAELECDLKVYPLFPMLGLDSDGNDYAYHWYRQSRSIMLVSAELLEKLGGCSLHESTGV